MLSSNITSKQESLQTIRFPPESDLTAMNIPDKVDDIAFAMLTDKQALLL